MQHLPCTFLRIRPAVSRTEEGGLVPGVPNPLRSCFGVREDRARNGPGLPCMGSPIEKEHDPSHQSQSQAVSAVLLGFRDESLLQLFPHRRDRKSTRLNSSHANISYAVFCLKKKTIE